MLCTKLFAAVISNVHHLFIKRGFSQLHSLENYNFKWWSFARILHRNHENPKPALWVRSAFLADSWLGWQEGLVALQVGRHFRIHIHDSTWASCGTWKASILSVKYVVSCLSSSPKLSCKTWSMWSVSRRTWSCFSKEICLLSAYMGENLMISHSAQIQIAEYKKTKEQTIKALLQDFSLNHK